MCISTIKTIKYTDGQLLILLALGIIFKGSQICYQEDIFFTPHQMTQRFSNKIISAGLLGLVLSLFLLGSE